MNLVKIFTYLINIMEKHNIQTYNGEGFGWSKWIVQMDCINILYVYQSNHIASLFYSACNLLSYKYQVISANTAPDGRW